MIIKRHMEIERTIRLMREKETEKEKENIANREIKKDEWERFLKVTERNRDL